VVSVLFHTIKNSHSAKPDSAQLESESPAYGKAQWFPPNKHCSGAFDLKPQQVFEPVARGPTYQIFSCYSELREVILGKINTILVEIDRHILPVVCQLEGSADLIRPL